MSVVVYTDGGARGNPGPAAAGVVIQKDGETVLCQIRQ
jgi:ribonuclease HI